MLRGLLLTNRPRAERIQFVAAVLIIALALPWALPWSEVIAPLCNMAFYAACWLIPYYLATGLVKRLARMRCCEIGQLTRSTRSVTAILGLLLLAARSASAEDVPPPVKVPPDAIIVPYDSEQEDPLAVIKAGAENAKKDGKPFGMEKGRKLLVPYDQYLELRRAAHPEERERSAPPADFALAGGQFTIKLDYGKLDPGKLIAGKPNEGDSLLVEGHLDVDVLVDHAVSVPLTLSGGVLTKVSVGGAHGRRR